MTNHTEHYKYFNVRKCLGSGDQRHITKCTICNTSYKHKKGFHIVTDTRPFLYWETNWLCSQRCVNLFIFQIA
jgi:hypothetical protein